MPARSLPLALTLVGVLAGASCTTDLTDNVAEIPAWDPEPFQTPLYRTAPGDVLRIEFARHLTGGDESGEYRLDAGDRLSIVFEGRPDLSRTVVIRPDGKISYFRVGEIVARDRTVEELASALLESFDGTPNAAITIFVDDVESRQDTFFDMLLASPDGPTREVGLRSDGTASLPLLGQLELSNLTIAQAETILEDGYLDQGIGVKVSVNVRSVGANRYVVVGSVAQPGTFALGTGTTVVEALAQVGGELVGSDLTQVVWITTGSDGEPSARTLDIEAFLGGTDPSQNPMLRPKDVVFVPRSGDGDVNRFIDLYVRRNLPFNFSVGAGWRLGD